MRKLLALLLLAPCALLAQVPDYVPTDGLVAYYPLDSTALDESGNGHHLTLDGPTWGARTEDAGDQALLFDGQDDVALIPQHPDFNSPEMSLSFWVNVHTDQLLDSPGLSDFMGIINKTDLEAPVLDRRQFDVQLFAESAGTSPFNLGWLASTGQSVNGLDVELVSAPANLPAFEWNHIVVTASDSTLSIHINGEHIATNALLHPRVLNTADIQIGRDYLGLAQRHFNGRMDDVAFYNRILTQEEIEALFDNTTDPEDRIGGALQMDGVDDYVSFTLPPGWGESSFTVSFSCTLEDFGSTDIDGYHYLFGHALTSQNGDIGFKAQTVPDAQQVIWAFSDDDGDGTLSLLSNQVLEPGTWYAFTLVFDRDSALAAVFVDGVPTGEAMIPATMGNLESGLPVGLGAFVYPLGGNLQHFHQGAFADVHFFPAALTEAEIHSLVQECTPPDIPGASHWGVNGDQYVNLTTEEPATVVGGTIVNDILPCPTPGTHSGITGGCTDPAACNYDPTATEDDGSCLETVSLELGPDILTCDEVVTLDASGPFNQYNWSNGSEEPITAVYSTGTYAVTVGFGTTNETSLDFNDELETAFISGTNNNCVQDYLSGSMDLGVAQNAISAVTVEFETSNGSICGGSCASWGIKLELRDDAGQTVDSLVLGGVFDTSCIQTGTTGTFTFTPDFTSDQTAAPVLFLQSVDFAWASARITHIEFGNPNCTVTDSVQVLMTDCATLNALCGEGSIWDNATQQCTDTLDNGSFPCGTGTVWDPVAQECIVAIPTDTDFDGCVTAGDVLNLLATFGTCPPVPEWLDTPPDTTGTSWMCGDPLPYEGYDYTTVQIGDQCWFAENLRNTAYSNGDVIETVSNIEDWVASTEGLVETYGTNVWGCQDLEFAPFDVCNPDSSLQYFGRHYNWYAVNDARGLCPSGWHVPSDSAFAELEAFLGLPADELYTLSWRGTDEGGQLKSSSTDVYPWNGSNSTGFSAVPSGTINSGFDTPFGGAGYDVVIWTSTSYATSPPYAWYRALNNTYNRIHRNAFYRHLGGSVRCIKD